METKRALLAVVLSMAILFGYQYFFVPPQPIQQPDQTDQVTEQTSAPAVATEPAAQLAPVQLAAESSVESAPEVADRSARDIQVETGLYSAVVSENGGGIKSFKLKQFRETLDRESDPLELVKTEAGRELPLFFSWGVDPTLARVALLTADQDRLSTSGNGAAEVTLQGMMSGGLEISRTLKFHDQNYLLELFVEVRNTTEKALQGAPYLSLTNLPFTQSDNNRFAFTGPAVLLDDSLQENKVADLKKDGDKSVTGLVGWAGYEDTYFTCAIVPLSTAGKNSSVRMSVAGEEKVTTTLSTEAEIIQPHGVQQYQYLIYFGPKKVANLRAAGHQLAKVVNFGWFDFMGKPALYLLNFFNKYLHNYGIAIILVTVLVKLLFWPIAQKGMKSMKTMQKIQPKMQKIKEKYKDDKERMNKEMMQLYQTYKVNPLGGCLPMLLQIPVFFALYRVLMQAIELRHAPFMLWITDLSAPDRLFIGFDLPMLGGLPVLTLLMGASMFLQQKMTPATGDPTQAKVMMFMPVIFTFMFINFASGLVLYWLVNNLLSILQQYVINRQAAAEESNS